jgi:hypothetical protein
MSESHRISGPVHGEPLPAGRVGARVRVPLSGTPGRRWSRVLTAHLAHDLTGHCAVGHLHLNDVVQGRDLVFDGVEDREAAALGRCVREAVEAANHACAGDGPARPANMSAHDAQAIARRLEEQLTGAPALAAR